MWYVRHNFGIDCLVNIENGLQARKFLKGTQFLSRYLSQQVESMGGKILYNHFVNKVTQNENGVIV